MLKRTAENAVWLSRYRVRTELLARLITLHFENLLDRPRQSGDLSSLGESIECWIPCLLVAGIEKPETLTAATGSGLQVLLAGEEVNTNSLLGLLKQMHTNLRCCRDFLPQEIYDTHSQLCLQTNQALAMSPNFGSIISSLRDIELQLLTISGQIEQRMAHNHIYLFLKAGELIERADFSTRILDMTEDPAFRDAPMLSLVSDADNSEGNKTKAKSAHNKPKQKATRSALSRQSIRLLALKTMGVDSSNTGAQIGPTVLAAPGMVDMRVVAKLVQDGNQPQSLAFCITELEKVLSELDPKQPAAKRCREMLRRVLYIDNTRPDWSRDDFDNIIESYQQEVSDMYFDIFDRYMRSETSSEINAGDFQTAPLKRNVQ